MSRGVAARILRSKESIWVLVPGRALRATLSDAAIAPSDEEILAQLQASSALTDSEDPAHHVEPVHHVTITMTTACNLACPYCFQNTGPATDNSSAPRIASRTLDKSHLMQAARFALARASGHGATAFDLMLFGGEPLLQPERCEDALRAFAEHLPVQASTITNGTRLSREVLAPLVTLGLGSIQLSLDGGRASHDITRATRGGRPSYDDILKRLEDVGDVDGLTWTIRINVTGASVDTIRSAIDDLASIPWRTPPTVCLDIIHDAGIFGATVDWGESALEACLDGYRHALDAGLSIPEPAWQSPCPACGHQESTTGTVIDADGDIVSCWEAIGRKDLVLGNIDGSRAPEFLRARRWRRCGFSAADPVAQRAIRDTLDANTLDLLRRRNLLGRGRVPGVRMHAG